MYGPVALARCSDRSRAPKGVLAAAARGFIYHGCLKTLQLGVRQQTKGTDQIVREKYRPAW